MSRADWDVYLTIPQKYGTKRAESAREEKL
jgi:hypothetical protein